MTIFLDIPLASVYGGQASIISQPQPLVEGLPHASFVRLPFSAGMKIPKFISRIFSSSKSAGSKSVVDSGNAHSNPADLICNEGASRSSFNEPSKARQQASVSRLARLSSVDTSSQLSRVESPQSTAITDWVTPSTSSAISAQNRPSKLLIPSFASGSNFTASPNSYGRSPDPVREPKARVARPSSVSLVEDEPSSQTTQVLCGAQHVQMGNLVYAPKATHVHIINSEDIERSRLNELPKPPDMSGSWEKYLHGSRQPDVQQLCERESSSTNLVLCVHGPAGIGKTTFAGHLSEVFRSVSRLAASIFLGAFPTDTSGPETIVKMLAYEIGSIHPRAIPKILEAMDQYHGTSMDILFQKYILAPLRSLSASKPFIVIIDAIDEWRDYPTFISALGHFNSESSIVKFVITSRLNPCASHLPGINAVSVSTYALGPMSREAMRAYFSQCLKNVPWVEGRKATSADLEKLIELSGCLPAWASTVTALLSHPFSESPPHEILAEIVGSRRQIGSNDRLGELYSNALRRLFPSSDAQKQFRRYFGATIVLQESLSISDFSKLAGIPSHPVNIIKFHLSALQTRSPPPGSESMIYPATTLFHLSFVEHVLSTSTNNVFAISAFDSHSALGLTCLKQLRSLPSSLTYPLRAIQRYIVKYWLFHVFNGTSRPKDQWLQTQHCSALQDMPVDVQERWAMLFLKSLKLSEKDELKMGRIMAKDGLATFLSGVANCLRRNGGDHRGIRVACLEVAVRIHDGDANTWSDLGWCYQDQGYSAGSPQMLEVAAEVFGHALRLQPESHPDHGELLWNAANALLSCYQQNGKRDILSKAISWSRKALTLCPAPHPYRDRCLNTLANALYLLGSQTGDISTLNEVISLHREALELRPPPHPDRFKSLGNLANALHSHYTLDGDIQTLDEVVSLRRQGLALHPVTDPHRPLSLNNLANALRELYRSDGDIQTLNEAISLDHEALVLLPASHPLRYMSLNSLGNCLYALYQYNEDSETLNECISLHREALGLLPTPHPQRTVSLQNLANALRSQSEAKGAVEVLDEVISLCREQLDLERPGHRNWAGCCATLIKLLEKRREATGDERGSGEIEDLKAEFAALVMTVMTKGRDGIREEIEQCH